MSEKHCRRRLRKSKWNKQEGGAFAAYVAYASQATSNCNQKLRSHLTKMLEKGPLSLLEDAIPIIVDSGSTTTSSFDPLDSEWPSLEQSVRS
jgi:hypothetical protein